MLRSASQLREQSGNRQNLGTKQAHLFTFLKVSGLLRCKHRSTVVSLNAVPMLRPPACTLIIHSISSKSRFRYLTRTTCTHPSRQTRHSSL